MSIRRTLSTIAFVVALALSLSTSLASSAQACDPTSPVGGLCP